MPASLCVPISPRCSAESARLLAGFRTGDLGVRATGLPLTPRRYGLRPTGHLNFRLLQSTGCRDLSVVEKLLAQFFVVNISNGLIAIDCQHGRCRRCLSDHDVDRLHADGTIGAVRGGDAGWHEQVLAFLGLGSDCLIADSVRTTDARLLWRVCRRAPSSSAHGCRFRSTRVRQDPRPFIFPTSPKGIRRTSGQPRHEKKSAMDPWFAG